ncbi:MAG: hypothetical protein HY606_14460 [Planctomycetes bacterium]|nr:hypothetical protein [Planctomycetota bacterium]
MKQIVITGINRIISILTNPLIIFTVTIVCLFTGLARRNVKLDSSAEKARAPKRGINPIRTMVKK